MGALAKDRMLAQGPWGAVPALQPHRQLPWTPQIKLLPQVAIHGILNTVWVALNLGWYVAET